VAATPDTIESEPDGIGLAEREEFDLAPQTPAVDLKGLLVDANLALTQGRLMAPPEASAYTLYSRVLALDPGSPEAESGLQKVRQGLINRALAQLAGEALDDARRTLEAAEEIGANPQLVADLRGEVDYRQLLVDASAGRFETLYPIDRLVAVDQKPPRRPRFSDTDADVEVQFTVTERGDVRGVVVLDNPPQRLERAVRRAVQKWRFEPVLYKGRPVPVRSSVRLTF
jgi:TonB family protein